MYVSMYAYIYVPTYVCMYADCTDRNKGGYAVFPHDPLAVYAKDIIFNSYRESIFKASGIIIISISLFNKTKYIIMFSLYRPPQGPLKHFEECFSNINSFLPQYNTRNILVIGGFCHPCVNWPINTPKLGKCAIPDKAIELLLMWWTRFSLHV